MLGIPIALAVFGYGEWATHRYLLHGLGPGFLHVQRCLFVPLPGSFSPFVLVLPFRGIWTNLRNSMGSMVGATGIEPVTPAV